MSWPTGALQASALMIRYVFERWSVVRQCHDRATVVAL